jgi:ABC-type Na+ efflux pump permease subunit
MSKWESFIDSLATAGGSIFLLTFLVLICGGALIYIMHHPAEIAQTMSTTFTNIMMALVGALVQALQSRSKAGSGTQTTTTTKTDEHQEPKPEVAPA